jgi:DNA-directed RNA polymerase, alpha subunit/40 kD subunit
MNESTASIASEAEERFWSWLRSEVSLPPSLIESLQDQTLTYRVERTAVDRLVVEVVATPSADKLAMPIEELCTSARITNQLRIYVGKTVGDLVALTEAEVLGIRGLSQPSVNEVKRSLRLLGLELRK